MGSSPIVRLYLMKNFYKYIYIYIILFGMLITFIFFSLSVYFYYLIFCLFCLFIFDLKLLKECTKTLLKNINRMFFLSNKNSKEEEKEIQKKEDLELMKEFGEFEEKKLNKVLPNEESSTKSSSESSSESSVESSSKSIEMSDEEFRRLYRFADDSYHASFQMRITNYNNTDTSPVPPEKSIVVREIPRISRKLFRILWLRAWRGVPLTKREHEILTNEKVKIEHEDFLDWMYKLIPRFVVTWIMTPMAVAGPFVWWIQGDTILLQYICMFLGLILIFALCTKYKL